ncbi:serine/threonine protein kinase [Microcoleus sp. OTE_8_concoct_300]|uniref:serine/threonine protein kinase n=1 Tax=Microcoleus sp. OTE_8_concoct_300 TaxID=2964710 RepID=UPI00403F0012
MSGQNIGDLSEEILADRYQCDRRLGKQAGRQTLLARDLKTQQQVVVKLLSFSSDFNWEDLKLFEREVETLKSLSHPAIPRYLDSFEIDTPNRKGFALVQTYIEAKSLQEYLSDGRTFSESEVKQLATALLDILAYLHQRHPPVIHRDIKPSNILLKNRSGNSVGEVYLVDFGAVQTLATQQGKNSHRCRNLWLYATRTIWREGGSRFRVVRLGSNINRLNYQAASCRFTATRFAARIRAIHPTKSRFYQLAEVDDPSQFRAPSRLSPNSKRSFRKTTANK